MAKIERRQNLKACWDEIWEKMIHQGDVGTASYAIFPKLVQAYASKERGSEIYAYAVVLEEGREERRNPDVPDWLQDDYDHGLVTLREMAFEDLRRPQKTAKLAQILAFLASQAGSLGLCVAIGNLDMNEFAMETLDRYGESLSDL